MEEKYRQISDLLEGSQASEAMGLMASIMAELLMQLAEATGRTEAGLMKDFNEVVLDYIYEQEKSQ